MVDSLLSQVVSDDEELKEAWRFVLFALWPELLLSEAVVDDESPEAPLQCRDCPLAGE